MAVEANRWWSVVLVYLLFDLEQEKSFHSISFFLCMHFLLLISFFALGYLLFCLFDAGDASGLFSAFLYPFSFKLYISRIEIVHG